MLCSFSLYFRFGETFGVGACLSTTVAWVECERRRTHCCRSVQHGVQGEISKPVSECERVYWDDLYVLCAHREITTGDVDYDSGSIGHRSRRPPRANRRRVVHELSDFERVRRVASTHIGAIIPVVRTNFKLSAHVFAGMRETTKFFVFSEVMKKCHLL